MNTKTYSNLDDSQKTILAETGDAKVGVINLPMNLEEEKQPTVATTRQRVFVERAPRQLNPRCRELYPDGMNIKTLTTNVPFTIIERR